MKWLLRIAPMLFVIVSSSAFATSISTFIGLAPNNGSGDNFLFVQQGPGFAVVVSGGTEWPFFNSYYGYAPGSTFDSFANVYYTEVFASFGGNSYEVSCCGPGALYVSSFTFPTNGKNFMVGVSLDFSADFTTADGQSFGVGGGSTGRMIFHFINGLYYPDSRGFVVLPEPSTFGFVALGLPIIFGAVRRRREILNH